MPVIQQNTITIFVNFCKDIIPIEGSIPTKKIVDFIFGLTRANLNIFSMDTLHKLYTRNFKEYTLYDYDFIIKGLHLDKSKLSENRFYKIHLIWNLKFVETKIENLYPYSIGKDLRNFPIDLRSEFEKI